MAYHHSDCRYIARAYRERLEAFYNSVRPHSALGWLFPAYFEVSLYTSTA